ncbi:MAG: diguanylate cyclase [Spirochaetia bacterium]|nr:diguanylate cyclase [Spirochaetia bacterium]
MTNLTDAFSDRPLLYVIEPIALERKELLPQVENFGYDVSAFDTVAAAIEAAKTENPSVLIAHGEFPAGATAMGVAEILQMKDDKLPVVYLVDEGDFNERLQAVRFGGSACMKRPVDTGDLIGVLDQLTDRVFVPVYRTLYVTESADKAEYISGIITEAQMEMRVLREPRDITAALRDFEPDVILLDMYYAEFLGMELAKIVRQLDRFHSTPVIYFTSDMAMADMLAATRHEGDDILFEPVSPDLLVRSITARVDRIRSLRDLTITDRLTGLLSHTAFMERLRGSLLRAQALSEPLSVGLMDIDFFRSVNDRFGHGVGNSVIKNMARLLKQNLGKSCYAGRLGGEEFGVAMPGFDGAAAFELMDAIRLRFQEIRHRAFSESFQCTFSCGIASFPEIGDVGSIMAKADDRLYQGKSGGRNKVVPAG